MNVNFKKYLPIFDWLPQYKKSYLPGDLSAGLTVGIMLIPQGMAYAMIAGLPPVYGLYAAMLPQVIYALFGTSRQLAVGPVAMDSILVAAGVSVFAVSGSENYIALAILLALMMGLVQLLFGLFKMGFLVNFLSKPVISGFTSAAALIIGFNQFKYLLGIDLSGQKYVHDILITSIQKFSEINWVAFAIGIFGILLIKYIKKIHRAIPGALIAVVLGILVTQFAHLDKQGVAIMGTIPQGLPDFRIPDFTNEYFTELISIALTLALIAFMEAISVAKAIQNKHKGEYELDANQEMIGLGMANIAGSFFGAYPTTGGFSRSAVNEQAGAKTNLAAIISAGLVGLTLLFLTPLFYYLPKSILAAIILVAVFGLIDTKYPKYLWKTNKEDFWTLLIAFLVTLGLGIKEGIGAGVIISILLVIKRTATPHYAILGRIPNTNDFRNTNRFQQIEIRKDILVFRYDAQLYFANISHFIDSLKKEIRKKGKDLKLINLHMGSVNNIDATALQELQELLHDFHNQNIQVYFSGLIGPVRDLLFKTGIVKEMGKNCFFLDVNTAVNYFDNQQLENKENYFENAVQTNVFEERII